MKKREMKIRNNLHDRTVLPSSVRRVQLFLQKILGKYKSVFYGNSFSKLNHLLRGFGLEAQGRTLRPTLIRQVYLKNVLNRYYNYSLKVYHAKDSTQSGNLEKINTAGGMDFFEPSELLKNDFHWKQIHNLYYAGDKLPGATALAGRYFPDLTFKSYMANIFSEPVGGITGLPESPLAGKQRGQLSLLSNLTSIGTILSGDRHYKNVDFLNRSAKNKESLLHNTDRDVFSYNTKLTNPFYFYSRNQVDLKRQSLENPSKEHLLRSQFTQAELPEAGNQHSQNIYVLNKLLRNKTIAKYDMALTSPLSFYMKGGDNQSTDNFNLMNYFQSGGNWIQNSPSLNFASLKQPLKYSSEHTSLVQSQNKTSPESSQTERVHNLVRQNLKYSFLSRLQNKKYLTNISPHEWMTDLTFQNPNTEHMGKIPQVDMATRLPMSTLHRLQKLQKTYLNYAEKFNEKITPGEKSASFDMLHLTEEADGSDLSVLDNNLHRLKSPDQRLVSDSDLTNINIIQPDQDNVSNYTKHLHLQNEKIRNVLHSLNTPVKNLEGDPHLSYNGILQKKFLNQSPSSGFQTTNNLTKIQGKFVHYSGNYNKLLKYTLVPGKKEASLLEPGVVDMPDVDTNRETQMQFKHGLPVIDDSHIDFTSPEYFNQQADSTYGINTNTELHRNKLEQSFNGDMQNEYSDISSTPLVHKSVDETQSQKEASNREIQRTTYEDAYEPETAKVETTESHATKVEKEKEVRGMLENNMEWITQKVYNRIERIITIEQERRS